MEKNQRSVDKTAETQALYILKKSYPYVTIFHRNENGLAVAGVDPRPNAIQLNNRRAC